MNPIDCRERDAKLFAAYPGLFARGDAPVTAQGLAVGHGWTGILEDLFRQLADIDAARPNSVRITQMKEKFGTLRVYLARPNDEAMAAIDQASRQSAQTCEFCGGPSSVRNRGGWFTTMCDGCAEKEKEGKGKG